MIHTCSPLAQPQQTLSLEFLKQRHLAKLTFACFCLLFFLWSLHCNRIVSLIIWIEEQGFINILPIIFCLPLRVLCLCIVCNHFCGYGYGCCNMNSYAKHVRVCLQLPFDHTVILLNRRCIINQTDKTGMFRAPQLKCVCEFLSPPTDRTRRRSTLYKM